jgi:hypothetical protein
MILAPVGAERNTKSVAGAINKKSQTEYRRQNTEDRRQNTGVSRQETGEINCELEITNH